MNTISIPGIVEPREAAPLTSGPREDDDAQAFDAALMLALGAHAQPTPEPRPVVLTLPVGAAAGAPMDQDGAGDCK